MALLSKAPQKMDFEKVGCQIPANNSCHKGIQILPLIMSQHMLSKSENKEELSSWGALNPHIRDFYHVSGYIVQSNGFSPLSVGEFAHHMLGPRGPHSHPCNQTYSLRFQETLTFVSNRASICGRIDLRDP